MQGPNWIYLLCAVNLFVYQTLDAIDGKHCFPTDTDDALPEFIDHGADALSNLLLTMCVGSAMGLNKLPTIALLIIVAQLALFYCYHWQCYISGVVSFKRYVRKSLVFLCNCGFMLFLDCCVVSM